MKNNDNTQTTNTNTQNNRSNTNNLNANTMTTNNTSTRKPTLRLLTKTGILGLATAFGLTLSFNNAEAQQFNHYHSNPYPTAFQQGAHRSFVTPQRPGMPHIINGRPPFVGQPDFAHHPYRHFVDGRGYRYPDDYGTREGSSESFARRSSRQFSDSYQGNGGQSSYDQGETRNAESGSYRQRPPYVSQPAQEDNYSAQNGYTQGQRRYVDSGNYIDPASSSDGYAPSRASQSTGSDSEQDDSAQTQSQTAASTSTSSSHHKHHHHGFLHSVERAIHAPLRDLRHDVERSYHPIVRQAGSELVDGIKSYLPLSGTR